MIPVDEAVERILDRVEPLGARPCDLSQCLGLVLAQDLIAREAHPPFDNSAMDGFAVCSADGTGEFPVLEDIAAGLWPSHTVTPGNISRIMTGAPMPPGADAVVMVEDTRKLDDHRIQILRSVAPRENIRYRGEHLAEGQVAVPAGTLINAAGLAMAAYLGYARPLCHPRLSVGVVSTGDELVEPDSKGQWSLGPGQIRNSNAYGLEAKLKQVGCEVVRLPALPDDPHQIARALRQQLETQDVLITSAGVSMGEKDYMLAVLRDLGAELHFWKVAMRPGRPLGFGTWQGKPIFALPGNPVSSMVTFEIFCRPALLKMLGHQDLRVPTETALSTERLVKKEKLRLYYRCRLKLAEGQLWATSTGPQDSHRLHSLVQADALMILPENQSVIEKGQPLQVLRVDQPIAKSFQG